MPLPGAKTCPIDAVLHRAWQPPVSKRHNAGMPVAPWIPTAATGDFLSALAAGLPELGFWSARSVIAVSGGADSVALFTGLLDLVAQRGEPGRLLVAHACHDLRDESPDDAAFVESLAAARNVGCSVRHLRVRSAAGTGGEGIEGRARSLRRAFFTDVARDWGARFVVLAHTADDQAETILHRQLRGTGIAGLAGMARSSELVEGISLLRPMLSVSRVDARAYLAARGQGWREDATNADVRYARNFLRHEILPRCEAGPYPAARAALVRLAGQAAVIAGALRSAARHLLDTHGRRRPDGSVMLQTRPLVGLDEHLVAEVFVALWEREAWPQRHMTVRHYSRLARLVAASAEAAVPGEECLPEGLRARVPAAGMVEIGHA